MAILTVPTTPSLAFYNQFTVLDGSTYQLIFHWNTREGQWYLTINDINGNLLVPSIKLVVNFPLLRRVTREDAPPGELFAIDTSGLDEDPGLDDLGNRVVLVYMERADLDEVLG